jgi:GNAT superfamily N-acetyltransferase
MMVARQQSAKGDVIEGKRDLVRPLLVPTDPADAMTAYYALMHDPRRVELTLYRTATGAAGGFVAVCQTGRDLFVPLVVMRLAEDAVAEMLGRTLLPGRPYTIVTVPALRNAIRSSMIVEREQTNQVRMLDPDGYRPVINVMVQPGDAPFRHEIRLQDRVIAAAGVNWKTDRLADMYVYTIPDAEGRGWAKAVGAACVQKLLSAKLLPLFTVSTENRVAQGLAETLGFRDDGAREYECRGRLRT